jgi:tRNA A37 threonylcarbamoyladenosine biosynthesis protein TsaE
LQTKPERIAELLPKKYITVKIESLSEAERRIEIGERGES